MAFSTNSTFTHVPIEEPHLHEVFRSTSTSVVKMAGGRPCEAFICTSRKNGLYTVFVSLLDTVTKMIHVMTPDEQDLPADRYRQTLEEARTLLTDLGFELEKVNIEFSAAIRQVVIRDIRVMHPPPRNRVRISRGHTRQAQEEEGVAADAVAAAAGAPVAVVAGSAAVAAADEKTAANASDIAALRDEISRLRRDGTHLEKSLRSAAAEVEKLRAGKTQAEAELHDLREALLRETVAATRSSSEATAAVAAMAEKLRLLEEELAAARIKPNPVEEPAPHAEVEQLKSEMTLLIIRHQGEIERLEAERQTAAGELEDLRRKLDEIQEQHRDQVQAAKHAAETIRDLEEQLAAAKQEPDLPSVAVNIAELSRLEAEMASLRALKEEECERLEAERTKAAAEAERLRHELLELQEKYCDDATAMRTLAEEADLARAAAAEEMERIHRRHEEEREELRALLQTRDEEVRALREELSRAQSEKRDSGKEIAGALATAEAEAARLRDEVRRLRQEMEAESLATSVEVELLRRKGADAEQTLSHLQEEHRRLTVERTTLLAAARKAKRLQAELQRLRADHAEREAALAAELQQRDAVVPEATPAEVAVQSEVAQAPPVPVAAAVTMTIPDTHLPDEHDMADSLALLLADGVGFAPANFGSAAVEFRIDHRLHDVEYESDEDVIAVYEAMNNVQAMPDGHGLKKCGAYICVVRRDGRPQVYNVWSIVDEGTALVAVPGRHEGDGEDGVEAVLKDALFYFESVGFIMEPLDLGNTRQKRNRALSRVSVLRKSDSAVAALPAAAREHAHASR